MSRGGVQDGGRAPRAAGVGVVMGLLAISIWAVGRRQARLEEPAPVAPAPTAASAAAAEDPGYWDGSPWQEERVLDTGFRQARAVAAGEGGGLLVAGDRALRILGHGPTRTMALEGEPLAVAAGPGGSVFVSLGDHLEVLWPAGDRPKMDYPSEGERAVLTSIAILAQDQFAADAGNRVVHHYGPGGVKAGVIDGRAGRAAPGGFAVPSPFFDVAAAPDGSLLVVDPGRHNLLTYTLQHELRSSWGVTSFGPDGFSGCCNPVAIAVLGGDRLVTGEKGRARVKVHSMDGRFLELVAGPESFEDHRRACDRMGAPVSARGLDLAVTTGGRVAVLERCRGRLRIFARRAPAAGSRAGGM